MSKKKNKNTNNVQTNQNTPTENTNEAGKYVPILDINGTQIGERWEDKTGQSGAEDKFYCEVKRLDGLIVMPSDGHPSMEAKYIEFEDTDGVIKFSPEPLEDIKDVIENIEGEDNTNETENEKTDSDSDTDTSETEADDTEVENTSDETEDSTEDTSEADKTVTDEAPTKDNEADTEKTEESTGETEETGEKEESFVDAINHAKTKIPKNNPFAKTITKLLNEVIDKSK